MSATTIAMVRDYVLDFIGSVRPVSSANWPLVSPFEDGALDRVGQVLNRQSPDPVRARELLELASNRAASLPNFDDRADRERARISLAVSVAQALLADAWLVATEESHGTPAPAAQAVDMGDVPLDLPDDVMSTPIEILVFTMPEGDTP